jgi:2-succinyl-6-hydroxy-2,4-cyclohexadiene-1-carboxylate synthase
MWTLIHGFAGSPLSWTRLVELAGFEPPPLLPTLAGHGRTWRRRQVASFESELERLTSEIERTERPRLVCGYSMGARVALGLLAHRPSLFDAAVLVGVHPGFDGESEREARREIDSARSRLLRNQGLAAFVDAWEALPMFSSQRALPARTLVEQRAIRLDHEAEGLARALELLGLAEMADYRASIHSAEMPITLVTGALDLKFSELAETLRATSSGIAVERIAGVGHNVVLEAPAALAEILKRVERQVA